MEHRLSENNFHIVSNRNKTDIRYSVFPLGIVIFGNGVRNTYSTFTGKLEIIYALKLVGLDYIKIKKK